MIDYATGRSRYTGRGVLPYRSKSRAKAFPAKDSPATTAAALHARFLVGQRARDTIGLGLAIHRLAQRAPSFGLGSVDLIEWYFTVHAITGLDTTKIKTKATPGAFRELSVQNQRKDGNSAGSRDPTRTWTFRVSPADKRALVAVIAASQRGLWTAQFRRSSRGLIRFVHTSRANDRNHRIRAHAPIPGQIDLAWSYQGRDPGARKLAAILASLHGREPRARR